MTKLTEEDIRAIDQGEHYLVAIMDRKLLTDDDRTFLNTNRITISNVLNGRQVWPNDTVKQEFIQRNRRWNQEAEQDLIFEDYL